MTMTLTAARPHTDYSADDDALLEGDASRIEELHEYATSRGLSPRVDREAGVISGVKVLGLASRNGRTYDRAAVAEAAALYEGVKVNVNHPKGPAAAPRDYQDRLGCLKNVRAENGGLFADLHFNPKHALAEQLAWDAEFSPENVGLSHNVQARTKAREGGTLVEQILKVNSVDLVADPATTRGLFESAGAERGSHDATQAAGSETRAERELREQLLQEMAQMRGQLDVLKQELQSVREARHVERLIESARPKSSGPMPELPPCDVRQWARSVT